jgi:putative colanic acid biosynthesis acetyltransferase WcaF
MTEGFDIDANRAARKWTRKQLAGRVLWRMASPLFALSPRPMWGWRRFILRLFGATVGRQVHVYPTCRISLPWNLALGDHAAVGDRAILYALGPITIGKRVTISQYAFLCAGSHDYASPGMTLLKPPVAVGDDAWICAGAFVGPGVSIGTRAILAARGVAVADVADDEIHGGNPARFIKRRPPFLAG